VLECYWWPTGELFAELRAGAEQAYVLQRPARVHMPSERVIDDINQSAYLSRIIGEWEQRNDTVSITPKPSASDDDILLVYAASHLINATATGYDTIPDEDLDIVADLTLAAYLKSRAVELALEPDYAEGIQKITKHFLPGNIANVVKELHRGIEGKYGGTGLAVVR